ncbi:MAG: hypothetical protein KTR33_08340 [Gammaproteobacteria bacterium]|nr:hypothetical protein [Gammaproteobacteria bacterium]
MASANSSTKNNSVKTGAKFLSSHLVKPLAVVLLVLGSTPSYAFVTDGMLCSLDGATRKIYIELEDPSSAVPCQVMENKRVDSPDTAVSLWSAGDDSNYCKAKLDGYIDKLRGLGFECW